MEYHSKNTFEKARTLKEQGMAVKEIVKKLGISRGTLLRWCFDMPSTNTNRLRHEKFRKEQRDKGKQHAEKITINQETAKMFAALLYWCEGYKYLYGNCIGFANSDVNLIKTFLYLFRLGFNPKKEKFKAQLQLHHTHDRNEIRSFWSNALDIPENCFYKPTITKALMKKKRSNYRGTCTVKYYDTNLYQELTGTYEAFFDKVFS